MGSMMQDLAFAIPGVDEAMSFAEIMKYVNSSRSYRHRELHKSYGAGVQACQIHGIFRDRVRHGPDGPHSALSLLSQCA